jgi:hypothetical protein
MSTSVAHARRTDADQALLEAVVALLRIKQKSGSNSRDLHTFVRACLESLPKKKRHSAARLDLDLHRLGSVMRTWHRETAFLSRDGSPRSLPTTGSHSLSSLVRRYYPAALTERVIAKLQKTKMVRRTRSGHWVPIVDHAQISLLSGEVLSHVSDGVSRFVETVLHNMKSKKEAERFFERSCKVHRLPASEISAFRSFVRQQASAYLVAIDDWLESKIVTVNSRKRSLCSAGVFTFAYLEKQTKTKGRDA